MPAIYVLSKNTKNIRIFLLKIIVFTAVKNCSILQGRVCVINGSKTRHQHIQCVAWQLEIPGMSTPLKFDYDYGK